MRKAQVDYYLDDLLGEMDRLLAYPYWLPLQICEISFYYQKFRFFSNEFQSFTIDDENFEYNSIDNRALSDLASQILENRMWNIYDPPEFTFLGDHLASELAGIYEAFMQDPQDFARQFYFDKSEHWKYEEDVFVGFQDESSNLLQQLVSSTNEQLQVFSIVGMAGLGKTTLATKLYNDPCVVSHFHVRAWLTFSKSYHKRDLLLCMLRAIGDLTVEVCSKNDEMLAQALSCALKGRRYLIVIDDIWSNEARDDFKRSFPDNDNRSRIMLTTRLEDVALHAQLEGNPLCLRFLTHEESFILFTIKASEDGCLSENLRGVGRSITQKYRDLPLAIVVIAGLLKNNMDRDWWMQVEESVGSYIVSDENQYMDTLELSYNHLPQHLRPCFLSFGAFPEDHDIPVWKLLSLWIAEGFIHHDSTKRTLEHIAEKYLMDLIRRSLVVVGNKGSDGVIKTCRIHDLLRDLCLRKAEEEIFSSNICKFNKHSYSCSHSLTYHSTKSRLLLCTNDPTFLSECDCYFAEVSGSFFKDVSIVWEAYQIVRSLDLSSIELYIFPTELLQLVHLKYLELRLRTGNLPEFKLILSVVSYCAMKPAFFQETDSFLKYSFGQSYNLQPAKSESI